MTRPTRDILDFNLVSPLTELNGILHIHTQITSKKPSQRPRKVAMVDFLYNYQLVTITSKILKV